MENIFKKSVTSEIVLIIILAVVLSSNVYFGMKYFSLKNRLDVMIQKADVSGKIADFEKLFVERVLKAKGEISYEDRLKLENTAVATKNSEVITGWHAFLASQTEQEAQAAVLELLSLFSNKTY